MHHNYFNINIFNVFQGEAYIIIILLVLLWSQPRSWQILPWAALCLALSACACKHVKLCTSSVCECECVCMYMCILQRGQAAFAGLLNSFFSSTNCCSFARLHSREGSPPLHTLHLHPPLLLPPSCPTQDSSILIMEHPTCSAAVA